MAQIWAYCRVSTLKTEQEESLDEQFRRAEVFARENDAELRIFSEQRSAKSLATRPVLLGLLAELEALAPRMRPKWIYVTALDRLGRDMADVLYVGRIFRNLKVRFWVGHGEHSLDSFGDRMNFVGQSIGGDAENEARSKRMKDSWERRRREGKTTSNKVPYGLQLKGERDVPIPESAEWVLKAFEWYAQGNGSYIIGGRMQGDAPPHTWLTTRIGDDGQRIEKTRAGTRWDALRVMKLLKQARYRGTIVPPDLFDEVQRRISSKPKNGSRRIREYPLSGAMRCDGCGRRLHGHATGHSVSRYLADGTRKVYHRDPTRYYSCYVCNYRLNALRIEAQFFEQVGKLSADPRLLEKWIAAPKIGSSDLTKLRREFKQLETDCNEFAVQSKRDRLIDMALAASLSDLELKRQMNRIDEDLACKRQRMAEIRSKIDGDEASVRKVSTAKQLVGDFSNLFESATYDQKRDLVEAVSAALGGASVSKASGLRFGPTAFESERPKYLTRRPKVSEGVNG
jgi:DNA invertase Pin-like site-specific DNA recombinase